MLGLFFAFSKCSSTPTAPYVTFFSSYFAFFPHFCTSRCLRPCLLRSVRQIVVVTTAALYFTLSIRGLYDTIESDGATALAEHSEISLGQFVVANTLLLLSRLFTWRWGALGCLLGLVAMTAVWIQQGACFKWACNDPWSHLTAAPWLIFRWVIACIVIVAAHELERGDRNQCVPPPPALRHRGSRKIGSCRIVRNFPVFRSASSAGKIHQRNVREKGGEAVEK